MIAAYEKRCIFGCGYLGSRVAARWKAAGHRVWIPTRSRTKASRLADAGFDADVVDLKQADSIPNQLKVDRLLFAVGFDRQGPESIRDVYVNGLRNVLDRLEETPRSLIYISSTGVYGTGNGEWVDESSPCRPNREGGQACLDCEQLLREHPRGQGAVILRLAGIYGPGRVPNAESLKQGRPVRGFPTGYLNLIHVDDAVSVVDLALPLSEADMFVVSDGHPVLRSEYYDYLARLYDVPMPKFVEPEPGSAKSQRGRGSKRVSNAKLVKQLGFRPAFPDYKTGLEAIVADSDNGRSNLE